MAREGTEEVDTNFFHSSEFHGQERTEEVDTNFFHSSEFHGQGRNRRGRTATPQSFMAREGTEEVEHQLLPLLHWHCSDQQRCNSIYKPVYFSKVHTHQLIFYVTVAVLCKEMSHAIKISYSLSNDSQYVVGVTLDVIVYTICEGVVDSNVSHKKLYQWPTQDLYGICVL